MLLLVEVVLVLLLLDCFFHLRNSLEFVCYRSVFLASIKESNQNSYLRKSESHPHKYYLDKSI